MRKTILFFIFIGLLNNLFGQKSPYFIRNYSTYEYGGFNQTWQIAQDNKGIIYVASTSAVYQHDGKSWIPIPIKKGAATRQILFDSTTSTIYVGSVTEFGCLEKDASGHYQYFSFVPQLNESQKKFLDVWKVHQVENRIYFQSAERIFVVENKKVIGAIEAEEGKAFALMFNCGEKLFVRQRTVGIMEVTGLKLKPVPNSEPFGSIRILGMIPANDSFAFLLTGDQGVRKFYGWKTGITRFETLPTSDDSLLASTGVLGMKWISKSQMAVYSRVGLMIFDKDWQLENFFTKKTGLSDESIAELFVDREKNIWLNHNNGFSRISYSSPALFYTDEIGFAGTIEAMEFVGDTIFLATTEGLFRSNGKTAFASKLRFKRALNLQTEIWNLYPYGKNMLLSTSEGLMDYNLKTTKSISRNYTNQSLCSKGDSTLLFTTEKGGFSIFRYNAKTGWSLSHQFDLPGIELMRMSEANPKEGSKSNYSFWVTTRLKSIGFVTVNLDDSTFTFREYTSENGVPDVDFYPVQYGDSMCFINYSGLIRYIPSKDTGPKSNCFEKDQKGFTRFFTGQIHDIKSPFNFRLFLETRISPNTIFFGQDSSGFYSNPVLLGNIFDGVSLQYGIIKNHETLWLLNQQSLSQYNLKHAIDTNQKFFALISHVQFKGDSVGLFYPDNLVEDEIEIPYKNNAVTFHFSAPYFMYDLNSYYSYMLVGSDTGWSIFANTFEKEYTNLPEGTYTFKVRAENSFGMISEEAFYTFTILPPWYRTGWAYLLYCLGFIGSLFISVRLGARRLRKQKEKLEILVTERTAEVVEQKQKIETQNFELESAYKGIQDSIHYAERIQHAILPVASEIYNSFPDSFVFFRPRDIVSGDFYWFVQRGNLTWVACVDCTGHGVPGAFMSMIGNTLLNEIVLEKNIEAPDKILNLLHVRIRQALRQDAGGETRDGMDISLCLIDKQKNKLSYAGANRAMWIMRNKELIVFSPDKFSIGGDQGSVDRSFTYHEADLNDGDCIYLSSDGYADQFGGPKGKKFMVKRFQDLLRKIHQSPMTEQQLLLEQSFHDWKGKLEQVDDVLVIGFRFNTQK